jgi:hypothetical protein
MTHLQLRHANLSGRGFGPSVSSLINRDSKNSLWMAHNHERDDQLLHLFEGSVKPNSINRRPSIQLKHLTEARSVSSCFSSGQNLAVWPVIN